MTDEAHKKYLSLLKVLINSDYCKEEYENCLRIIRKILLCSNDNDSSWNCISENNVMTFIVWSSGDWYII